MGRMYAEFCYGFVHDDVKQGNRDIVVDRACLENASKSALECVSRRPQWGRSLAPDAPVAAILGVGPGGGVWRHDRNASFFSFA